MKKEQERIAKSISAAEGALAVSEFTAEQIENNLNKAVVSASNCYETYKKADEVVRREMNQAFFNRIWVDENGVTAWEYNQPFALLMSAHGVSGPIIDATSITTLGHAVDAVTGVRACEAKERDPSWLARVFPDACSKERRMAE